MVYTYIVYNRIHPMSQKTHYTITWLNTVAPATTIVISQKHVSIPYRCMPHYRIPICDIHDPEKCIPNLKIISAYHNPRGGDFIIYDMGIVSDTHCGVSIGVLKRVVESDNA